MCACVSSKACQMFKIPPVENMIYKKASTKYVKWNDGSDNYVKILAKHRMCGTFCWQVFKWSKTALTAQESKILEGPSWAVKLPSVSM